MTANKMPEMPEAVAYSCANHDASEIGYCQFRAEVLFEMALHSNAQLQAYGRACYLAGIADAKAMIESMQEYKPALQKCRPAKTGYIAFMGKKAPTLEGEEYGWINTGTTLTNLTALEQEAKK